MSDDSRKGFGCVCVVAAILLALLFAGGFGGRVWREFIEGRSGVVHAPGELP